jgi:gag-polypeptide of LTR copia-type
MISPDPMEIWLTKQRIHQAAGLVTSLSLCQKFLTAKKSDHQTMQAWIGQIQGLAFHMEHAKIAVTDQDKILAITMGLPPSFDNVIINFNSMLLSRHVPTMANHKVCLLTSTVFRRLCSSALRHATQW